MFRNAVFSSTLEICPAHFLDYINKIECEHAVFKYLQDVVKQLGFEFCQYVLRIPLPISRPHFIRFDNYSEEWQRPQCEHTDSYIDSIISYGLKSPLPIQGPKQLFTSVPKFWASVKPQGLNFGLTIPFHDCEGTSGILIALSSSNELSNEELAQKQMLVMSLGQLAHHRMRHLITPRFAPEQEITLTDREKEVLLWTAEGKTSCEIGDILGIAERTVNFHINNSIAKLKATNKIHATVKAALLGKI